MGRWQTIVFGAPRFVDSALRTDRLKLRDGFGEHIAYIQFQRALYRLDEGGWIERCVRAKDPPPIRMGLATVQHRPTANNTPSEKSVRRYASWRCRVVVVEHEPIVV